MVNLLKLDEALTVLFTDTCVVMVQKEILSSAAGSDHRHKIWYHRRLEVLYIWREILLYLKQQVESIVVVVTMPHLGMQLHSPPVVVVHVILCHMNSVPSDQEVYV